MNILLLVKVTSCRFSVAVRAWGRYALTVGMLMQAFLDGYARTYS